MLSAVLLIVPALQEPAANRFPDYPEQDAIAYEVALDVRPAERRLEGRVRYRFRAVEALERIRLHATRSDDYEVRFVDQGGAPLEATWSAEGVAVELGEKTVAGGEVTFAAELRGTPPDGFYFKNNRYGEPLAFTDHYSIRARGWLPCEDHPADRARFATTITFPAGNLALASGATVEAPARAAASDGGGLRVETRSDIPPYMYAIVVGPYAEVEEAGDPRLVPHFVYRRDVDRAKSLLVHHAEWIRLLEGAFGGYAYAKYTTVQCPTRWGGFEAPGNVQLAERIFDSDRSGTLAHELVHMWFGDAVGYAQWREVWLSEGFASYFGPWLSAQTGGPAFRDSLASMRARWRSSGDGRVKSIRWAGFAHPDRALNANTYPKGAWILHMLRGELGDATFFGAIRDYYLRFRGSSVVSADFVASVERSTGRELGWFFEQWLDRVGCPELAVSARDGGIVVEQRQTGEPYRFRLRLAWTDAGGVQRTRVFEIHGRRTELDVEGGVGDLVVDPDVELLFREAR